MARWLPVLVLLIACVAAEEPYRVKFELDNLNGKAGQTGSFVMEINPDW